MTIKKFIDFNHYHQEIVKAHSLMIFYLLYAQTLAKNFQPCTITFFHTITIKFRDSENL